LCLSPLQPVPILVPAAVLSHPLQDNLCASVFCKPPASYFRTLRLFRIHCTYFLVIFDHAPVAQRPHANQPTEFGRRRPTQTVPSGHADAPRCRSSCSARQTGMSRPCHFQSPSPTIFIQSLYAARRPVRIRDKVKRTKNPPWRFCSLAAYLFKTLGDAKGIYSQALIPFQPGMRGTREKNSKVHVDKS
jgi:hypothetical protein